MVPIPFTQITHLDRKPPVTARRRTATTEERNRSHCVITNNNIMVLKPKANMSPGLIGGCCGPVVRDAAPLMDSMYVLPQPYPCIKQIYAPKHSMGLDLGPKRGHVLVKSGGGGGCGGFVYLTGRIRAILTKRGGTRPGQDHEEQFIDVKRPPRSQTKGRPSPRRRPGPSRMFPQNETFHDESSNQASDLKSLNLESNRHPSSRVSARKLRIAGLTSQHTIQLDLSALASTISRSISLPTPPRTPQNTTSKPTNQTPSAFPSTNHNRTRFRFHPTQNQPKTHQKKTKKKHVRPRPPHRTRRPSAGGRSSTHRRQSRPGPRPGTHRPRRPSRSKACC